MERNNRRIISVILLVLLILLFVGGIILYFDLRSTSVSTPSSEQKYIPVQESAPIEKGVLPNGVGVSYEMEGTFTEDLRLDNGFLRGRFALNSDPLGRDMEVILGSPDGAVYVGFYQGSFDGASSWEFRDSGAITETVKPGDSVKITVVLENIDDEPLEYLEKAELVLDTIIKEYSTNDFSFELPDNLVLSASRLGIIK